MGAVGATTTKVNTPKTPVKITLGKIIEITWLDNITLQHTKKDVVTPHWMSSIVATVKDGKAGSFRPSAYRIGQQIRAKVKIECDKPQVDDVLIGFSADKKLKLEGKVKSVSGKQAEVEVLSDAHINIACFDGDFTWELNGSMNLGSTRLEVYVLHSLPTPMPSEGGSSNSWVEVLRFCFKKIKVSGASKVESLTKITKYCFSMGLKYDVLEGSPSYLGPDTYTLMNYINLKGEKIVNCVDQACALIAISGMIGIESSAILQRPFGYLKPINLIGYGLSNNPFFKSNRTDKMYKAGVSKGAQTAFGMHTFVASNETFSTAPPYFIFDSCSGPACFVPVKDYYDTAIDYPTGVQNRSWPPDFTGTFATAEFYNWLSGINLV